MKDKSTDILNFTQSAIAHIQSIIANKSEPSIFRLTVKVTGCTGLMYIPEVLPEPKLGDIKIEQETRIDAYVDPEWMHALEGTTVDYVKKDFGQSMLHFDNPNADSLCGCGESFNLKSANGEMDK